ncbi:GrlR family regulatory protein [Rhodopseudomonas palustris]|uniref:GrlR family regulatory protein n=1 Tax=Rhodopseudomonas palustris TaxID=1076 RepID=UPI002ACE01D0|nr:GrlR family regulatory protein [Rhodopseudomonas palustris]WQH00557.1 GrlR family regulatory protein [Rhodopseudomonas palustris]
MTNYLKGFYAAEFETARKKAHGVVLLQDGQIRGGDSTFAYIGSYTQEGLTVSGSVRGFRHANANHPDHVSVFGIDPVEVVFDGVAKDGYVSIEGVARETPSLSLRGLLTRIGD